ncbi:MAG TPA: nucleotidyltransferase family protein [Rhodocyclaceae bacterium]|nr:nucleotidyltransferase family protein [Rhodocyclaceae bacterium]
MKHDLTRLALKDIDRLRQLRLDEWDLLIRQARSADLLARLAVLCREAGLLEHIPAQPRMHFESALVVADAQDLAVRREVDHVRLALNAIGVTPILLKGGAYLMADLPAAQGRLFSDLDILVPHERIGEVEATLMLNGWATTHHDPYDQRYYRQWMHELPPMLHIRRMTVLDVHHAIVPTTADLKPDTAALFAAAQPVPEQPGIRVLAPTDMVLHSATHLFYNEEFSHGLRDMSDLDLLLRHFTQNETFWPELLARARALGLTRPLHYCLRYCSSLFDTPIPAAVLGEAERSRGLAGSIINQLWLKVLGSTHPSARQPGTALATFVLYLRAHWHRMPPALLVYHLCMKSLRPRPKKEAGA